MEINELRTGNIVYNHRHWMCQVVAVDSLLVPSVTLSARHYGNVTYKFEDLKPVPLTPEYLESRGFERYLDGDRTTLWRSYGEDGEGDIEVDFCNETIKVKIDVKGHYHTTDSIRFIHELQNLFVDCKIAIELKPVKK